ncbi:ankyrin repeat domain-containing protein [Methylobacterium sp. NMS14P]|uniref:ankyrin repeat domain-containing protein n=1 Tax=Methylobacterium sp. NMS14P TaxID=2894310 RepID=UPI0023592B13|nr:ankyrin repeat domain-containing protein [Methylobacterium sp. NMS14P]WCS26184.1 ankyrin repeat domain-containing protein [Methylobacterium sp. NMS14P]
MAIPTGDYSGAFRTSPVATIAAAVARGDVERIAALAPGLDLSIRGDRNLTLLEWAIWNARPHAVSALLDAGADPSVPGLDQETVLHMAAMVEDPAYLEILLRHGAPVDPVSPRGQWTPLFRAVQNRRETQIALLLRAGADPNRIDATGNSLLHVAAQVGAANPWVLRLLEAGIDPTLRNAQRKTFQPYFFTTPERLLNDTARETRAAVRAWLARHGVPAETGR